MIKNNILLLFYNLKMFWERFLELFFNLFPIWRKYFFLKQINLLEEIYQSGLGSFTFTYFKMPAELIFEFFLIVNHEYFRKCQKQNSIQNNF